MQSFVEYLMVMVLVTRKVRDNLHMLLSAQWNDNLNSDQSCIAENKDGGGNCIAENGIAAGSTDADENMDDGWCEPLEVEENAKLPEMYWPLRQSMLKAFKLMDKELQLHPAIDCFCSGSTTVALVKQNWVEVTVNTQVDILIEAVNQGFNFNMLKPGNEVSRTMVFANTVEAVEAVANILSGAGIHCFRYHRDGSLEERAQNLVDFQQKGGVFVCTDAAARGLDVTNVSHVIQAEFASSAVDFIHRVGRTARAGQPGLVTSLYTESNKDLVAAVRQAGKLGQPVEKAFSRKRSFRNRIKKRALSSKDSEASSIRERIQV